MAAQTPTFSAETHSGQLSIWAAGVRVAGEKARDHEEERAMKQYLISMYQPDGELPPPEFLAKVMAEIGAIRTELQEAGAWVFGAGLHAPSTATVLRAKDGDVLITDGPFTEGKEHLGGVTIIKAPDLDAALAWARRYALVTTLPIEVRPFQGEAED
jgi:hypothetical protein